MLLGLRIPRGAACLWITSREDGDPSARGEVLHVTPVRGAGRCVDPKRLQDLRAAARAFLSDHEGAFVVLDCIDTLTVHNGVERVVRTVADLHEDAVTLGATLVVVLDPKRSNPRLVAWLERELDGLPDEAARDVGPDVALT